MFMGLDGFKWFTGVVEDRKDPDKRGRVRVRIHALHSKEKQVNDSTGQGIPTDDLPWATVVRPITSAAMDGIGQTPLGLVEGTWVFGFARDGDAYNDLLILGSIGGKPEDPPDDKRGREGFVDPRSAGEIAATPRYINEVENRDPGYPGKNIPQGRYPQEKWLNEIDVNRLARGEKLDETLIKPKKDDLEKLIPTAFDAKWNEMAVPYAAEYPYNHVYETESGHVMEFDDTKGSERWHLWHKSKTYAEIHPDGKMQLKTQKDFFTVARGNIHAYSEKDIQQTAKNNFGILSKTGDVKIKSALGDVIVDAFGEINMTARGQNSFHMTAEAGPMIARTEQGAMILDSMTALTMASNTGSITQLAPLGGISATALMDVQFTSAAGAAGLASLGGNVNLTAAAGQVSASAMGNIGLNSISGSIVGLAQSSVSFTANTGALAFVSTLGQITALAQAGMALLSNTGSMLMRAEEGELTIQNAGLGPNDILNIDSNTSLGIRTALGSIAMETENPLGTGLSSDKAVEVKSTEASVSVSSAISNVELSAPAGTIGMQALEISIEADLLNFVGDDIVLEGTNSVSINSLTTGILLDAATSIDLLAGSSIQLESATTFGIISGAAFAVQSSTTIDLTTGTDLVLDAGTTGSMTSGSTLNLEAGTIFSVLSGESVSISSTTETELISGSSISAEAASSMALITGTTLDITCGTDLDISAEGNLLANVTGNIDFSGGEITVGGTTVSINSAGDVSITGGSASITMIGDVVTINGGTLNLNANPNFLPMDSYTLALKGYFDTIYAPI